MNGSARFTMRFVKGEKVMLVNKSKRIVPLEEYGLHTGVVGTVIDYSEADGFDYFVDFGGGNYHNMKDEELSPAMYSDYQQRWFTPK